MDLLIDYCYDNGISLSLTTQRHNYKLTAASFMWEFKRL